MKLKDVLKEEDSPATQAAHKIGLVSKGYGNWADPNTGQTVAKTINGKLEKINKPQEKQTNNNIEKKVTKPKINIPDTSGIPDGANHDTFKTVLPFDYLKNNGIDIDPEKEIGRGYFGIAYETSDDAIGKATTDEDELRTAKAIKNSDHKLPNLVDVYDIVDIDNDSIKGVIKQEKLTPLDDKEKKLLEPVENWVNEFFSQDDEDFFLQKIKKNTSFMNKRSMNKIMSQLVSAKAQMKSIGINRWADFNLGNVMKSRDGTIKILDIGATRES